MYLNSLWYGVRMAAEAGFTCVMTTLTCVGMYRYELAEYGKRNIGMDILIAVFIAIVYLVIINRVFEAVEVRLEKAVKNRIRRSAIQKKSTSVEKPRRPKSNCIVTDFFGESNSKKRRLQ